MGKKYSFLKSFHILCKHVLGIFWPYINSLCTKISLLLTTYPPLCVYIFCESSLLYYLVKLPYSATESLKPYKVQRANNTCDVTSIRLRYSTLDQSATSIQIILLEPVVMLFIKLRLYCLCWDVQSGVI